MLPSALVLVVMLSGPSRGLQPAATACDTWEQCRDRAIGAAVRQDYEAFHDLAWRAMQRGPRNSPELMALLARAQSLSGRPHDALVMLQRLAGLGFVTDATESDDFRRVRARSAWSDFEQQVADLRASGAAKVVPAPAALRAASVPPGSPAARPATAPAAGVPGTSAGPERIPAVVAPPVMADDPAPPSALPPVPGRTSPERPSTGAADARADDEMAVAGRSTDALRFSTRALSPGGLVHDVVSNRFIIADRVERRLAVIGAQSRRLSILAAADSAGFGDITAMAIDAREGDLWVISQSDEPPSARLHKLQLISGRLLYEVVLPEDLEPARFADVAPVPGSGVLVLDAEGRRVLRVPHRSREIARAAAVDRDGLASIAPVSPTVAYVAHAAGIARLDLSAGTARDVKASAGLHLRDLQWIRYRRGGLVAVQKTGAGRYRVVRLELDAAGRTITRETVLDPEIAMSSPPPAVISGDSLYYLAETPAPDFSGAVETIVRGVRLK